MMLGFAQDNPATLAAGAAYLLDYLPPPKIKE
jgi:hypothetical protein